MWWFCLWEVAGGEISGTFYKLEDCYKEKEQSVLRVHSEQNN